MMKLKTVPRGKIIPIGSDELEVWPWRCVDGHRCIQCYFMGKTACAPQFWGPPTKPTEMPPLESKAPVEFKAVIFSLDKAPPSGEGTLCDYLAAQPVEPLNDGGFTEEITERINALASQLTRTPEPYRTTDESCPKCGSQYPLPWGTRNGKERYFCPRCGKYWTPSPFGIPPGMKELARELRHEGLTLNAIRLKVAEVYHKKVCMDSIWKWTKGENKLGRASYGKN